MGTISRIGGTEGISNLKNTASNAINNFIDNVSTQLTKQNSSPNEIETEEIDLNNLPTNDYNQALTQESASNTNWDEYMEGVNRQAEENDAYIELYTNIKADINNTIESSEVGYEYETLRQMMNTPGSFDPNATNEDLERYYNFTGLSKYGIHNREELDNYMDMLDKSINSMQYNKKSTENFKQLVPYLKIMSGEDYKKYKNKDVNSEDLSSWVTGILSGNNSTTTNNQNNWNNAPRGGNLTLSYGIYNDKTNEPISPVDFLRMVNGLAPQLKQYVTTTDIEDLELLNLLLEASEINPDLLKCYNFLFYNQGKEEATKFLKAAEEEINKTVGIKRAGEFLSKLPKDKNIKDISVEEIELYLNELYNGDQGGIRDILVALKGGKDGIRQYFEGLKGWLTESTSRSALDFEKMYILYALMPESNKKKMGLIGEDGKSIIDPTILDFSQNYSDKLGITDNIYEISTSIGNMVPSMIIGSQLPGIGSIGAGTVSVFLSSGGNARREGLINGMDATKATFYGIVNGMSEAALVELLSTLPGLRNKEEQIKTLKQLVLGMVKEGKEEGIEEVASILIDYMFTGEMVTLEEATLRVGKSALYGAITSGIMNTPGVAMNKVSTEYQIQQIKKQGAALGIELTDEQAQSILTTLEESNNTQENTKTDEINNYTEEMKKIIGEKLSSWIPNEESAKNLYTNLMSACKNAGIEISDLNTEFKVLDEFEDYYARAKKLQLEKNAEQLETYRTHGIVHVIDVLTQSINTYNAFTKANVKNLSLKTIMLAAIMHDTGMSGGIQIQLELDENEKIVFKIKEVKSDAAAYRMEHAINSAVNLLKECKKLGKDGFGYSDLEIIEASLLAFSHSKSNSGLKPLSGNNGAWSFAIDILSKATEGSDFNILKTLEYYGIISNDRSDTSTRRFKVKSPDGEAEGYYDAYKISKNWMEKMCYESLILRIGDALTNNDNAGINQYGDSIFIDIMNYIKQFSIKEVMEHFNVDESLTTKEKLKFLMNDENKLSLSKVAKYEAQNVDYKIGNIDYTEGQQFVLGENNQKYRIENTDKGDVEVVITVKNSDAIPFCTIFAINERLEEINSKGPLIFNYMKDIGSIKLVVEIDPNTSESVKDLYQSYADIHTESQNSVDVEIRERVDTTKLPEFNKLNNIAKSKNMTLSKLGSQSNLDDIVTKKTSDAAKLLAIIVAERAKMSEPKITSDIKSLQNDKRYLTGLSHKLKTIDSLKRKILSDSIDESEELNQSTLNYSASKIADSVRYTMICDENTITTDITECIGDLIEKGYNVLKFKNTFDGIHYKGVNVPLRSPDGTLMELQFHTEQSFFTKEKENHVFYEIYRNKFTTDEEKKLAGKIMETTTKIIKIPNGILDYKLTKALGERFSNISEIMPNVWKKENNMI